MWWRGRGGASWDREQPSCNPLGIITNLTEPPSTPRQHHLNHSTLTSNTRLSPLPHNPHPHPTRTQPAPPPSAPPRLSPMASPPSRAPADTPSALGPSSYTDAFRGREAHTKFADPCEHARAVSCPPPACPPLAGVAPSQDGLASAERSLSQAETVVRPLFFCRRA